MPRQTVLPTLGTPPKGYTWSLRRVQGRVGGLFGAGGHTYYLTVSKGGRATYEATFYVSKTDDPEVKVREVSSKVYKKFS